MIRAALQSGAEIIQLHAPEFLLYAGKLKRSGRKVIFDSHEFYSYQIRQKQYLPKYLRNLVASLYYWYEGRICRKIDAVIYPCTIDGQNYFEGRAKRSQKIENYSVPMFAEHGREWNNRVVYAGSLTKDRGIVNIADAILKTDGELVLCGPFESDALKNEILKKGTPDKIRYAGVLDRHALFREYCASSIALCLLRPVGQYAHLDNMSTKVYEYMQCGLPVVLSNFPCYRRQNDRFHFGICVDPENVEEIAEAIRRLLGNPEEARQMGENGRRAVEQEFNWGAEEKKLLALYQDILNQ
jgi:glycosyltransferase involved in cell wall biosynthesis